MDNIMAIVSFLLVGVIVGVIVFCVVFAILASQDR